MNLSERGVCMSSHGSLDVMMAGGSEFTRSMSLLLRQNTSLSGMNGVSLADKALGALSPGSPLDVESFLSGDLRSPPSLNAELSARSAFADSPCSAVDVRVGSSRKGCRYDSKLAQLDAPKAQFDAPKSPASQSSSPAKLRCGRTTQSQSRQFLRKGSRMARSQPPVATKRIQATTVPERQQRLEPREAFKQATAALASSTPASKRTGKTAASKSAPPDGSSALVTPQRGRARANCVITPVAVTAPVKKNTSPPRKARPSFAWCDPAESPDESQDEPPHSEMWDFLPSKLAQPEKSLVHDDHRAGMGSSNILDAVIALRNTASHLDVTSTEFLAESAPRDLDSDFEEARSVNLTVDIGAGKQLRVLDEQITRFQQDNEALARLRKQAEQAEVELSSERESLRREVEEERKALQAEADREREELRRERLRLEKEAEAKRREAASERLELRERLDELRKELAGKERHWQKSVERLQRQVTELAQKNQELLESSAKTASTFVVKAVPTIHGSEVSCQADDDSEATSSDFGAMSFQEPIDSSHSSFSRNHDGLREPIEVPPLPELAPPVSLLRSPVETEVSRAVSQPPLTNTFTQRTLLPTVGTTSARARSQTAMSIGREKFPASRSASSSVARLGNLIREDRSADGRSDRFFEDGRHEVLFLSGLRKVQFPDGRMCVFFQNGDVKESFADGTVVYRYHSTGAVQTTKPDGTDIFQFAGGQVEYHRPDGSKEIEFTNGARKRIWADGLEEVSLADSGGVWTPLEDGVSYCAAGGGA